MPGMSLPREIRYEPQHECRQAARLAFRKHFGDRYFNVSPGRCGVDGEGRTIPPRVQPDIAKEVWRLRNTATASSRFVERHSGIAENLLVTGFAAVASCGAGGSVGHWWQDGAKRFDLLHPSLGAIAGAVAGLLVGISILDSVHKALVEASYSLKRYERSSTACDALISGYITEPDVQRSLLTAVKEAKRPDGAWPEGIRFKILEIRACGVLSCEVAGELP
jgi:hypothetical protein